MTKLIAVRSMRNNASVTHLAINTGWSSIPLCGAMKNGGRSFPRGAVVDCPRCLTRAAGQDLDPTSIP